MCSQLIDVILCILISSVVYILLPISGPRVLTTGLGREEFLHKKVQTRISVINITLSVTEYIILIN